MYRLILGELKSIKCFKWTSFCHQNMQLALCTTVKIIFSLTQSLNYDNKKRCQHLYHETQQISFTSCVSELWSDSWCKTLQLTNSCLSELLSLVQGTVHIQLSQEHDTTLFNGSDLLLFPQPPRHWGATCVRFVYRKGGMDGYRDGRDGWI